MYRASLFVYLTVFAMLGLALSVSANELSGDPNPDSVISQDLPENMISVNASSSILIAVSASNYWNTLEHDALVATLTSLGYGTVDVTTVAQAQASGADVIIAYIGCYTFSPADLNTWISSGKGYIQIGDWTDWFSNSWQYVGDTNTVDVTITNPGHPIAQGLPSSWTGVGFWEYGYGNDCVGWTFGYTEVGELQAVGYLKHDEGISVTEYGSGKAVYFGFNVYGSSAGANELTLLRNAIGWMTPIEVAVDIKPETLNLKSKGEFTAFINLPEGYDEADIVLGSVECEGAPALKSVIADDAKLVVKFDSEDLDDVPTGDAVELTVTGKLTDGTLFRGSDTVRVIGPGKSAPSSAHTLSTTWGDIKSRH